MIIAVKPMKRYYPSGTIAVLIVTSGDTINCSERAMDTKTAREFFANDRYAALTGVQIVEAGKGYCRTSLKIEEKHLNAANVVQGGAIFTLADLAFAVASNSHGQLALAINVNISYLKALSTGTLHAVATEVNEPDRLGAYDVLVTDDRQRVIARFNGMVYRKRAALMK